MFWSGSPQFEQKYYDDVLWSITNKKKKNKQQNIYIETLAFAKGILKKPQMTEYYLI